mgnify:FL=1
MCIRDSLGSKSPHIQNLAVGGVMNAINLDSMGALNMDRLYAVKSILEDVVRFIHEVYFPDVCAVAANYLDWFGYGAGDRNYLAVPDLPTDGAATEFDLPGGVIVEGDLANVRLMDGWKDGPWREAVTEDVTRAWYQGSSALHPWKGETIPNYTDFQPDGKYSWVKAPRYQGHPMEVGPLAQMLVGYAAGNKIVRKWTDLALDTVGSLAGVKATPDLLMSTLGRHAARAVRAAMMAELVLKHWQLLVDNVLGGDSATFNAPKFPKGEVQGVGLHEAPRGTLSHWVVIENGKIQNYQAVVPTTWNASPRDAKGKVGPYEASLEGNPVADPEQPLELLRTLHSFDPCMACAVHTIDPKGKGIAKVSDA